MELKPGDNVLTLAGEQGTVVHTSRLTVFVAFATQGEIDTIKGYLESQLTKVKRPPPLEGAQ